LALLKSVVLSGHGFGVLGHAAIRGECESGAFVAARIIKPNLRQSAGTTANPNFSLLVAVRTLTSLAFETVDPPITFDQVRAKLWVELPGSLLWLVCSELRGRAPSAHFH
jgi:hypothetical protein